MGVVVRTGVGSDLAADSQPADVTFALLSRPSFLLKKSCKLYNRRER